jgi:hypothetical protein
MSHTITDADMLRSAQFLDSVKAEFDSAKAAESSLEDSNKVAAKRVSDARQDAAEGNREASGFNRPKLRVLAKVGASYQTAYLMGNSGPAPGADSALQGVVDSYLSVFTNRTAKSAAGGTPAAVRAIVGAGTGAERVRKALADRVAYHFARLDSNPEGESADEKKDRIATARRYTEPAKCDKEKPKHLGGESRAVNGIFIGNADGSRRGGTNIDSLFAVAVRHYAAHGENALHPDVIDAILDNGGRVEKEKTAATVAATALAAVKELLDSHGGRASGDAVALSMFATILGRIAESGNFKGIGEAVAPPPAIAVNNAPPPVAEVVAPEPMGPPAPVAGEAELDALIAADTASLTGTAVVVTPESEAPKRRGKGSLAA